MVENFGLSIILPAKFLSKTEMPAENHRLNGRVNRDRGLPVWNQDDFTEPDAVLYCAPGGGSVFERVSPSDNWL